MAISAERIDAMLSRAAGMFADGQRIEAVVKALKAMEPAITVTGTHADSMSEDPFKTDRTAAIYLVDNTNHCWVITESLEAASGVVIGQMDEET